jgi:hypothetical protein
MELSQPLTELTIEQQFKLKVYADETQSLSAKEAQIFLIQMTRQNMIKDNVIRHLIGNQLEQA